MSISLNRINETKEDDDSERAELGGNVGDEKKSQQNIVISVYGLNETSNNGVSKTTTSTTTTSKLTKPTKVVFDSSANKAKSGCSNPNEINICGPKETSKSGGSRRKSTNSLGGSSGILDEHTSGGTTKSSKSQSSRMHSLNERLRSVFDLVRPRLNAGSSANAQTRSTTTKSKSSTSSKQKEKNIASKEKDKDVAKVTAQSKHLSVDFSSGNNAKTNQDASTNTNQPDEMETCQLCYNQCFSNPTQSTDSQYNYIYQLETCEHQFCAHCLRQYLKYQIIESRVSISCPQCAEKMHPSDIYRLLLLNIQINADQPNTTSSSNSSSTSASPLSTNSLIISNNANNTANTTVPLPPLPLTLPPPPPPPPPPVTTKPGEWSQLIDKYEEFMLRRVLVSIPDTRFCPAPDCSYAVIASGCANCPQIQCQRPECNTSFCYHCKQRWHPNLTCEDAALRSMGNVMLSSSNGDSNIIIGSQGLLRSILGRSNSHLSSSSSVQGISTMNSAHNTIFTSRNVNGDWIKEEIKRCPKCQALIVKMDDGSCNHITCSVCGCEFCWLCMKEISDLHYLSPSGCTFWGKKPWSRKKKIMWQLGTLVGAPVGIALIAGVAVPAILIGLPIWAGRKVYIRYKSLGKHKRNAIVVSTVFGTILVAPLVAALAVGIGVPILLAYVYGVVPISLCRSGGCGVTTNNNGGVRFAFDDEPTTTVDNASYLNQTTSSIANNQPTTSQQLGSTQPATNVTKDDNFGGSKSRSNSIKTGNLGQLNSVTIPIDAATKIESPNTNCSENNSSHLNQAQSGNSGKVNSSFNSMAAQTPLFVTITMGNKQTSNSITYSNCSSSQMVKGRHHRVRHRSSSSSSSTHRNNKQSRGVSKKPSSSKIVNTASIISSASIACGTVELTELHEKQSNSQILKNNVTSHSNRLLEPNGSSTSQNHRATSTSKSAASETGAALNYLNNNSNNNNNNNEPNSSKKSLKNMNPSIGEMSLGEDMSLDDIDYIEDDKSINNSNNANKIVKIIKKPTFKNDDLDEYDDNNNNNNNNEDRSDRDSASNRAIAGDLASVRLNSESIKIKKEMRNRDDPDSKLDLKSNYTINSYEKAGASLHLDADAYSVSIVSEKSINPSVAALVGSIKDNMSVSNLST